MAVDILHDGASRPLASWSRFCRKFVDFAASGVGQGWMEWLMDAEPSVVIPCTDDGVEVLGRWRGDLLEAGHRPIEADPAVLLAMLDKARTYQLARELGVPSPRTATVSDPESLVVEAGRMSYPCATKPAQPNVLLQALSRSRVQLPAWAIVKGMRLSDEEEARRVLLPVAELGVPMLLTEVVEGPDDNYCSYYSYLDGDGTALFHFTKRKLRQYPIHFGGGTYHKTEWQADVAALGLRFFQGVGLRGIGNVEFKRDGRDGQLKLIECNPRLTAADGLLRAAGIDLAHISYCAAIGRPVEAPVGFVENKWQWLPTADIKAFRAYRQCGEMSTGRYLASLVHWPQFPVWDPRDPVPAIASGYASWTGQVGRFVAGPASIREGRGRAARVR